MTLRAADNPFRSSRVDRLVFRAPGFDWTRLETRLGALEGRGALRGPCGSGKSTLLRDLAARLADRGLEVRRLRPDLDDPGLGRDQVRAFAEACSPGTALLLDGADRVRGSDWRRFLLAAQGAAVVVVTSHRRGRLPTLYRCSTSVELLADLVRELAPERQPVAAATRDLFERHRGDIRCALRELFDQAARSS